MAPVERWEVTDKVIVLNREHPDLDVAMEEVKNYLQREREWEESWRAEERKRYDRTVGFC